MTTEKTTKELSLPERAAIALGSSATEAHLAKLVKDSASITEITNAAGREECHRALMTIKSARTTIEKVGKAAREDATAFSKAVIKEEDRLIAITAAEEKRLQGIRDAWDAEIERKRQEAIQKEQARVQAIQAKIHAIKEIATGLMNKTASVIQQRIEEVQDIQIDASFQEFDQDAQDAKDATVATLRAALAERQEFEAEQERIRQERAELERQQAEQEARRREEQDRLDREAADRAESIRIEQEAAAERQRLIDAENQRIADELAETRRLQEAEAARLKKLQDDLEARQAAANAPAPEPAPAPIEEAPAQLPEAHPMAELQVPSFSEIVELVADKYEVSEDEVRTWIQPA